MTDIAIIANEPTPYRLALHRRIAEELQEATLHTLYTAAADETSMPWKMGQDVGPQPIYFASGSLAKIGNVKRSRSLFREVVAYLEQHRVRLIVCNGYGAPFNLMLIKWAKQRSIPLLVRGDSNLYDDRNKSLLKQFAKRLVIRRVTRHAAGLMPMGTMGQAYFRHYANHHLPTFLCPYEPDYARWQNVRDEQVHTIRHALGWNTDRQRLLYSGRFVPQKRVDLAIQAFCQVADQRPHWDLVLVGDGELKQELQTLVPTTLKHRIEFLGFRQTEELPAIYKNCHALIHPADREPWGLIINEAVASGLPILTTSVVGAAVDLVRHRVNGILVDPGQAKAMERGVLEMTREGVAERLAGGSSRVLEDWRLTGDPVRGIREAMAYFGSTVPNSN